MKHLFLFFLLHITIISLGQNIDKMRQQAEENFAKGDAAEALSISQKIVSQTEKEYGTEHPEYARAVKDHAIYLYFSNYNLEEATPFIQKAIEIYHKNPGRISQDYLNAYSDYGFILVTANKLKKAEEITKECIEIKAALSGRNDIDYAILLNNLAEINRQMGKMNESIELFSQTEVMFRLLNYSDSLIYANLLNNIANVYHDLNDYPTAKKYYDQALEKYAATSGKDSPEYDNAYKNYSILLADLGKYDEAKKIIEELADSYEKHFGKTSFEYATCLNDLGEIHQKFGNYKSAENYFLQAEEIKRTTVGYSHSSYITTLNNLAALYAKLGNITKAVSYGKGVISSMEKAGLENSLIYATYLSNLGTYYQQLSYEYSAKDAKVELDNAEEVYKKAMHSIKENIGTNSLDYSRIINNYALLQLEKKNYDKAEELYLESLSIIEKQDPVNEDERAITFNNLGEFYSQQKDFVQAEQYFTKALNIYRNLFSEKNQSYLFVQKNLALLYYRWGKTDQAIETARKAQELTLQFVYENFSFMNEEEKNEHLMQVGRQFDFFNLVALVASEKKPAITAELFNYAIQTKSMILHQTSLLKKKILESDNQVLRKKYNQWEQSRELLSSCYELKKSELKKRNLKIDSLETEIYYLEKEISSLSYEFLKIRNPTPGTWQDVRDRLKDNEAAVEIIQLPYYTHEPTTDSNLYIALIVTKNTKDYPLIVKLGNSKRFKKYYKIYTNEIQFNSSKGDSYNVYWKEIDKHLEGKTVVYLSPAGVYRQLSLPSLKLPDGRHLVDTKQIHYLPGFKEFISASKNKVENNATLFGYPNYNLNLSGEKTGIKDLIHEVPLEEIKRGTKSLNELPGTEKEVEAVYKILTPTGMNVTKYLGDQAREAKVKELKNPAVLHIATHGFYISDYDLSDTLHSHGYSFYNNNSLFRSGVLLAGANNTLNHIADFNLKEDGILTAYEAMHLNLDRTNLVILSACETGLGRSRDDIEGVYGLQRAFHIAGAQNTLMSLWEVSDEATQELMELFYKYWVTEKDSAKAFRLAQIELKKKYPSPIYWGAFIYSGK